MSDALYEQYKDALRRGHVAALHGQLDVALAAYEEAAGIAPERALPHASRGTVLARLGRQEDALAAFDAALACSSADEVALTGRAEVLQAIGRRGEAAAAYDRLAAVSERAGRLVAALDAARRALEAAESRGRRDVVRELSARIGASPLDDAARGALEQALRVLETDPHHRPATPSAEAEAAAGSVEGAGTAPSSDVARPDLDLHDEPGLEAKAEAEPGMPAESQPEPEPEEDVATLSSLADEALAASDPGLAAATLLRLARAQRRAGRLNAALDACYLALSLAPDDPHLHLELVALYDTRGWTTTADEKMALLRRLVELDGDLDAIGRVESAVSARPAATAAAAAVVPGHTTGG